MTIFRSSTKLKLAAAALSVVSLSGDATAQALAKAIKLAPLSSDGGDVVQVRNIYGRCGSAVVQVLGVREQHGDFYTVDSGAGNADIVVIQQGGRPQISLKKALSDYKGLSCVQAKIGTRLLIWSNCGGSACGDGFSYTIVDPSTLDVEAGKDADCNALCAARLLGDDLPLRLDHLKVEGSGR